MKSDERRKLIQLMGLGFIFPQFMMAKQDRYVDSVCKKEKSKRVLVVYASEYGSTQGVAKAVGKTLCSGELGVDVRYVGHVKSIEGYEQVVIGSPIQYDTWMDEARDFVIQNEESLSKISVSYFFTCLTLSQQNDKTLLQAQGYADSLKQISEKIQPTSIGQFAGVLDYSKFAFAFRLLARGMFAVLGVKEGDYRDWDAIEQWSKNLKG